MPYATQCAAIAFSKDGNAFNRPWAETLVPDGGEGEVGLTEILGSLTAEDRVQILTSLPSRNRSAVEQRVGNR